MHLVITSIKQTGVDAPANQREVVISFADQRTVKIYGRWGGFVQYGYEAGLTSEVNEVYAFTLPIAEHYTKWLNGGKLPADMQQVPTASPLLT
jgi:hypothetical protein